jgi:pimeloyl-ACP methyl ester carboxylesterase
MRVDGPNGIVVVGGYGAVGRTVCAELAGRFPGRVFAAGRNLAKADAFSREMGDRMLPLGLELADPGAPRGSSAARAWSWRALDRWFRALQTSGEIRRDLRKYALSIPPREVLLGWHEELRYFDRPALVVWASEDRVMSPEHGRRLAGMFPNGRLVEIPDSYTLIPEDRPGELARAVRSFVRDTL